MVHIEQPMPPSGETGYGRGGGGATAHRPWGRPGVEANFKSRRWQAPRCTQRSAMDEVFEDSDVERLYSNSYGQTGLCNTEANRWDTSASELARGCNRVC